MVGVYGFMECHSSVDCGWGLWNATCLYTVVRVYGFMECHTSVVCGLGSGVYGMPHVCNPWFRSRGLWNAIRL